MITPLHIHPPPPTPSGAAAVREAPPVDAGAAPLCVDGKAHNFQAINARNEAGDGKRRIKRGGELRRIWLNLVFIYVCMCVYVYMCVCVCVSVCVVGGVWCSGHYNQHALTYASGCARVQVCKRGCVCVCVCVCVRACSISVVIHMVPR